MSKSRSRNKKSREKSTRTKHPAIGEILKRWQKANPDPRCELYYETPYQLLVSVILSAQATDRSVNQSMQGLYEQGLDQEQILSWGESGLLTRIRRIGLAPTKAKNIVAMTKKLRDEFDGKIPQTREQLESLPGVGRKTANVILGEVFREPTLAVDTHVLRVSQRLGLHTEQSPTKAEQALTAIIDKKWLPQAHHWFILHGRHTCKARQPMCSECCLSDLCPSHTS